MILLFCLLVSVFESPYNLFYQYPDQTVLAMGDRFSQLMHGPYKADTKAPPRSLPSITLSSIDTPHLHHIISLPNCNMTTSTSQAFRFPREHSFPPFFTLQPTSSTLHAQLRKWSDLILAYFAFHKLFRLTVSTFLASELFKNERINRGLDEEGLREVLGLMKKEGRIEWIGNGKPSDGGADVCWVWWKKPEEWARVIEEWVDNTGQKGSVLTLYELVEGEGTKGAGMLFVRFSLLFLEFL